MINISTITPGQMDTRPLSNMHVGQTTTIKRGGVIWLYYKFHFLSWQELVKFCAKNTRNVHLIQNDFEIPWEMCGWWYAVIQKFQSYFIGLVSNIPNLRIGKLWAREEVSSIGRWVAMGTCDGYLWLDLDCLSIGLIIKLVSHPKVIECQGNSEHNSPCILLFIYSGQIVLSGSDATSGAFCFCCCWSRSECEWDWHAFISTGVTLFVVGNFLSQLLCVVE